MRHHTPYTSLVEIVLLHTNAKVQMKHTQTLDNIFSFDCRVAVSIECWTQTTNFAIIKINTNMTGLKLRTSSITHPESNCHFKALNTIKRNYYCLCDKRQWNWSDAISVMCPIHLDIRCESYFVQNFIFYFLTGWIKPSKETRSYLIHFFKNNFNVDDKWSAIALNNLH